MLDPTDNNSYTVIRQGDAHPYTNLAYPLHVAIEVAKEWSREHNDRYNVFKLIQTHTFAPAVCNNCNEKTVTGGELLGPLISGEVTR